MGVAQVQFFHNAWVTENLRRVLKRDAVLSFVGSSLGVVPIDLHIRATRSSVKSAYGVTSIRCTPLGCVKPFHTAFA